MERSRQTLKNCTQVNPLGQPTYLTYVPDNGPTSQNRTDIDWGALHRSRDKRGRDDRDRRGFGPLPSVDTDWL